MEPQVTKFLSGGLNLLTAGDAVPEGQALALQNWRTDQAGVLRSRKSHNLAASPGGNVHTIASVTHTTGKSRYYGADKNLFRDATEIETGSFDGNPLGIVSFQDFAWVMNRLVQVRDDGTGPISWTPQAATAAPTASVEATAAAPTYGAGSGDTTTGSLSGPIVYVVTGVVPGVGEVARSQALVTTSHHSVPALNWGVVPDSSWKGFTDHASNLVTPPSFADGRITQWNLYRVPIYKDPQQQAFAGTYQQVGYLVNSSPIAIAATYTDNGNDNTGTGGDDQRDAAIVKRGIVLGFSVVPSTVTAQFSQTGALFTLYRSNPTSTTPQFPFQANYQYYVTGVTVRAEETNPSPALTLLALATEGILITRPAFADGTITGWNLYRSGGTFPQQPYLVNQDPIPIATTTYYDTGKNNTVFGGPDQSDAGILEDPGQALRTDRDPPPPASGVAGPYFGKLLAFNSLVHPNRIWWTPSDEPWNFPGSASEQDGNWVDVGDGDPILGIAVYPRRVAILKPSGIHRMVGDPDDWGSDIERTNAETGQIGGKAYAIAGSNVFLQSREGIGLFNGDITQKISQGLDPIFKGDTPLASGAIPSVPISSDLTARSNACMAYRNGRLYFSYPDANQVGEANDATFLIEEGRFFTDSRAFTALYDEGQQGDLLGAFGGNVYVLESGTTEANIPLIYQSRYEDQGAPENYKRYADILVEHNTGGRVFTLTAYVNNGDQVIGLGTFSSTSRTQTIFKFEPEAGTDQPPEYRNISIRLECDTGNAEAEIFTLILHYLPVERNAQTYDTGRVALEKVSLLGSLEFELNILSGAVTYQLWSGLSNLAVLAEGTFEGPALATFTAPLPDGTEARWLRLRLLGDNFRCHGARIQIQPYGRYLAGVNDIFRSGDLTFGSPRQKLLQQIRFDCDPDGTIPGEFYSDEPGAMASRQALSLVATPGRTWQRQNFPLNTRGRVCRVELTAPAVCRLYAIQVRVKILGEPGGWQWMNVPVPETPPGFSWFPLPIT